MTTTDPVSHRGVHGPEERRVSTSAQKPWPRYVNAILGGWLFLSAFIIEHTSDSRTNTWIVGALMAIFALVAVRNPPVRFANTALAVWLFFSTLAMFAVPGGALWHNVIVALVAFVVSLIPNFGATNRGRGAGTPLRR